MHVDVVFWSVGCVHVSVALEPLLVTCGQPSTVGEVKVRTMTPRFSQRNSLPVPAWVAHREPESSGRGWFIRDFWAPLLAFVNPLKAVWSCVGPWGPRAVTGARAPAQVRLSWVRARCGEEGAVSTSVQGGGCASVEPCRDLGGGWRHTWGLSAEPSLGSGWASHLKAELSAGRQCEVSTARGPRLSLPGCVAAPVSPCNSITLGGILHVGLQRRQSRGHPPLLWPTVTLPALL